MGYVEDTMLLSTPVKNRFCLRLNKSHVELGDALFNEDWTSQFFQKLLWLYVQVREERYQRCIANILAHYEKGCIILEYLRKLKLPTQKQTPFVL